MTELKRETPAPVAPQWIKDLSFRLAREFVQPAWPFVSEDTCAKFERIVAESFAASRGPANAKFKPVMQTISGIGGNCFQACVASIFGLDLAAVPHFFAKSNGGNMTQEEWDAIRTFAAEHKTQALGIEMPEEPELRDKLFASGLLYVAIGPSYSGTFGHCVVGKRGEMVHDPFEDGKFLAGEPWLYIAFEPAAAFGGLDEALKTIALKINWDKVRSVQHGDRSEFLQEMRRLSGLAASRGTQDATPPTLALPFPTKDDCLIVEAIGKAAKQINAEFDCLSDHVQTKKQIREQISSIIWKHLDKARLNVAESRGPAPDAPQLDRLRDFVEMVREWTAKFPLKGEASEEDKSASTEIYCCCEGAEENIYELRQRASHGTQGASLDKGEL